MVGWNEGLDVARRLEKNAGLPKFFFIRRPTLECERVMNTGFERAERDSRGGLPLAVLLLLSSIALRQANVSAKPKPAAIRFFKCMFPT